MTLLHKPLVAQTVLGLAHTSIPQSDDLRNQPETQLPTQDARRGCNRWAYAAASMARLSNTKRPRLLYRRHELTISEQTPALFNGTIMLSGRFNDAPRGLRRHINDDIMSTFGDNVCRSGCTVQGNSGTKLLARFEFDRLCCFFIHLEFLSPKQDETSFQQKLSRQLTHPFCVRLFPASR